MGMKILWDKSDKPLVDGRWGKWHCINLVVQYEVDGAEHNLYINEDRYYQLKIKDDIMTTYNVPEKMLEELIDRAYSQGSRDESMSNADESI